MPIELRGVQVERARLTTTTTAGVELIVEFTDDGLEFFVTTSSSGATYDKPIKRSADDLWDWIENKSGGRVKLKNRAKVKRTLARSKSKENAFPE